MSKERFSFILFLALIIGAITYSPTLQSPFIDLSHQIKNFYLDAITATSNRIEEHFSQAETIAAQRKELEKYQRSHLISLQFANELSALLEENNATIAHRPDVTLVRALSYVKFGDINKVWLDFEDFNASRVYGLVHADTAAGIAIDRNGKPLALLNSDRKSAYAVFVGPEKAPGIVHGNGGNEMMVEYIPIYKKINIGDEVITSGLDHLFFAGLKVGKVTSVMLSQGYQTALVHPYYDATHPEYFHLIRAVR